MKKKALACALAATVLFTMPAMAEQQPDLTGSEWGYPGQDRPFIGFKSEMRIVGNAGCNNFFGTWEVHDGDQIELGPLGATRMACAPEIMQKEQAFLKSLEEVTSYRIVEGRLQLLSKGLPWTEMERRDRD